MFRDFEPEFSVFNVNGEEPHTGVVESISNDNPSFVSCVEDERQFDITMPIMSLGKLRLSNIRKGFEMLTELEDHLTTINS